MRQLVFLAGSFLATLPLHAQTLPLVAGHEGYAIDAPRVLVQQRLFGLANAVSLLAATCVREPGYREALVPAYMAWREQQEPAIDASYRDLAHYFFGARAAEADQHDIATALKLRNQLDLEPGSAQLHAACDTFDEALQKPYYDLRQQYQLQALATRLATAVATETRSAACRARFPDTGPQLDAAMLQWQDTYRTRLDEAKSTLEQHWPEMQIDGTLDQWLAQVRNDEKKIPAGNTTPCETLPQWLLTKQADPDDAFNTIP